LHGEIFDLPASYQHINNFRDEAAFFSMVVTRSAWMYVLPNNAGMLEPKRDRQLRFVCELARR
jgi:hypothetical protein